MAHDLEVPQDVQDAARKVTLFFAERNIQDWKLHGVQSRTDSFPTKLTQRDIDEALKGLTNTVITTPHPKAAAVIRQLWYESRKQEN